MVVVCFVEEGRENEKRKVSSGESEGEKSKRETERRRSKKKNHNSPEDQRVVDRNGELYVAKVARAGRAGEAARDAAGVFFVCLWRLKGLSEERKKERAAAAAAAAASALSRRRRQQKKRDMRRPRSRPLRALYPQNNRTRASLRPRHIAASPRQQHQKTQQDRAAAANARTMKHQY